MAMTMVQNDRFDEGKQFIALQILYKTMWNDQISRFCEDSEHEGNLLFSFLTQMPRLQIWFLGSLPFFVQVG